MYNIVDPETTLDLLAEVTNTTAHASTSTSTSLHDDLARIVLFTHESHIA